MGLKTRINNLIDVSSARSKKALVNIAVSFAAKLISIVCTLLVVPLTIQYVNPTEYGIWMTVSSVIAWIGYFDLGLGNGLRNKFAEAIARDDVLLAKSYVSTTYISMTLVMAVTASVLLVLNSRFDWPAVLNLDVSYSQELRTVFAILTSFFCINQVVSLFGVVAAGNQNPGLTAMINALGQLCALGVIIFLVNRTEGSLVNLALYYSGIPCILMLIASLVLFNSPAYKNVAPSFRAVRLSLVKNIMNLGVAFFVICISMLLIFQLTNIILMRECGADAVTRYNIAFRYFNVLFSVFLIILTPYWSAFTDAYSKSDADWMRMSMKRLERLAILAVLAGLVMLAVSPWFYKIWIKEPIDVPFRLSVSMFVYTSVCIISNVYMYLINGIGKLRIQMTIYLVFALVSWPLITLAARVMGVEGVLVVPTVVYAMQAIFARIQLNRLINNTAYGWFAK